MSKYTEKQFDRFKEDCRIEYEMLKVKHDKLIAWAKKLDEVSDYEYPFCLNDRDDIQRPDEILKEIGE